MALCAALVALGVAGAAPVAAAPGKRSLRSLGYGKPLYADGQTRRYRMGGRWLYRADPLDQGLGQHFERERSPLGWTRARVPSAWNATDLSVASMLGSVGWYRRDFKLPDTKKGLAWVVRFESINYRAEVWLNGRALGGHTGAYLPWELQLKRALRKGTNHLVVRVDSRRAEGDLPPLKDQGWWNYGGLLREVYLRRVDQVDIRAVDIRPGLRCAKCAATVPVSATVHSYARRPQRIHVTGSFGRRRLDLGTRTLKPGATVTYSDSIRVGRPKLWSPSKPNLYRVELHAGPSEFDLHTGIRHVSVRKGRLYVNYKPVRFRGVGLHEDSPTRGAAIGLKERKQILKWLEDLGATFVRAHYPLSPEFEEIADHHGIMLWSEIPAYHLPEAQIAKHSVQDAALSMLDQNIAANGDHPSIIAWSIGNEQGSTVEPGQAEYIKRAADLIHTKDPTRLSAYAFAGHPSSGCQTAAYKPLDLLGFNDYFGWYTAEGTIADRDQLSSYLDTLRACYPTQALAVTEFGAESNRSGPVEEKGTYEFQNDFIRFHMKIYASKPWLAGVSYWALQEFKVSPGWSGGNPRPISPIHAKGLVSFAGVEKPAFSIIRSLYHKTRQYGRWKPARRR